jgi:phage repressor protein C with HTH and peptisase S24 domain
MKIKYRYVLQTLQNLALVEQNSPHREIANFLCEGTTEDFIDKKAKALANKYYYDGYLPKEDLDIIERKLGISLSQNMDNSDLLTELNYYPNIFGSCGTGLTIFDETSEKISVTKDIITGYSASNQYSVISARGSSMSPTINDDDKLIIQHNQNEQIIDDNVYLFRYNDQLFIKRLVKNIDQIVCISENPRFEDRVIIPTADNFSIVGKVVGLFRSKV